jgi:hypothetical protein
MIRTAQEAKAFIRERRIVLVTGRASVPNLAEAIAGRALKGSWMAHPECHRIWDILCALEREPFVTVPLILGKRTMLDPSLAPALERLVKHHGERARAGLSKEGRALLRKVESRGRVRMDQTSGSRRARIELERAWLVRTREVHTERGSHASVLEPWNPRNGGGTIEEAAATLVLAAARSAGRAPEREARRWFVYAGDAIDSLLQSNRLRRRGSLILPSAP